MNSCSSLESPVQEKFLDLVSVLPLDLYIIRWLHHSCILRLDAQQLHQLILERISIAANLADKCEFQ
jgi:hypothetical protein